jgi:hypothetical protein
MRRRGYTLAEIIVYTGLFALVGTGVAGTFIGGNRWYMQNRAIINAEASADVGPRRLAKELMESTLSGICFFPNTSYSSSCPGIIFLSPRDPSDGNQYHFNGSRAGDAGTGAVQWFKYVCYYVDSDPQNPGLLAVYRKEWQPWSDTSAFINAKATRCDQLSTLDGSLQSHDTNWFRDNNNLAKLTVAHNIAPATVVGPNGGWAVFSGSVTSPNYDTPSNPIIITVTSMDNYYSATQNIVKTYLETCVRN